MTREKLRNSQARITEEVDTANYAVNQVKRKIYFAFVKTV